jgi:hypothetical protein
MVVFAAGFACACSGYVVYSNETIYGMNYDDRPGPEMYFSIQKAGELKYFLLCFEQGGQLYTVTGMNNQGCFMSIQMAFSDKPTGKEKPTMLLPNAALSYLRKGTSLQYIENLAKENYMINPSGWTLHSLLADATGRAMILEVGKKDNIVIPNEKNFHVMTNFNNANFIGKDYREIQAVSADRYKSIYKMILEKMGHFTFDIGFDILKGATQSSTRSSVLYYPKKGEIYVVMDRNFARIWRISLTNETIETYRGFKTSKKVKLDDNGITETELSKWK